jgi:hypothetical protein
MRSQNAVLGVALAGAATLVIGSAIGGKWLLGVVLGLLWLGAFGYWYRALR